MGLTLQSISLGDVSSIVLIIVALIVGWTKIKIQVDSLKDELAEERAQRELGFKEAILRMEAIEGRNSLMQEKQHSTDIQLAKLSVIIEEKVVKGIVDMQKNQESINKDIVDIKVLMAKTHGKDSNS
jgi:hypothetical protein